MTTKNDKTKTKKTSDELVILEKDNFLLNDFLKESTKNDEKDKKTPTLIHE